MTNTEDFTEQSLVKAFQRECQGMAKDGTLTPERQFVAMMLYLPETYIKRYLKKGVK